MTHYTNLPRLEQGYRHCTHCSGLNILPESNAWKTMCGGCYIKLKSMVYDLQYRKGFCTDCCSLIEPEVLESSRRLGRRLDRCQCCHQDFIDGKPSSKRIALIESLRTSVPT